MHRKGRNPRGEDVTNNRLFNGAPPRRNAGRLHRCSHSAHFKTHAHTRTHAYTHTYTHTHTQSLSHSLTHIHTRGHTCRRTQIARTPSPPLPHAHTLNAHIPLFESCCCELIIVAKNNSLSFCQLDVELLFFLRARACVCVCVVGSFERGFPRKFAHFVLFYPMIKRSFQPFVCFRSKHILKLEKLRLLSRRR